MKTRLAGLVAALLLTACATHSRTADTAPVSTVEESQALGDVLPLLQAPKRTLVVFDIDDTVLTSETFFGSDHWYEWQKTLAAGDPGFVPCRFDVIALNYEAGTQRPTEPQGPELVNGIQTDRLFLTARNAAYRGATERELARAGYTFPTPLGRSVDGMSFSWTAPGGKPATVEYANGIYMVSGQDKGKLLLALLERLGLQYGRVILVDDGRRNIDAMRDALRTAGIDYHGLHYTRVRKPVPVTPELAREGIAGWASMREFLSETFPTRLKELESGRCHY